MYHSQPKLWANESQQDIEMEDDMGKLGDLLRRKARTYRIFDTIRRSCMLWTLIISLVSTLHKLEVVFSLADADSNGVSVSLSSP